MQSFPRPLLVACFAVSTMLGLSPQGKTDTSPSPEPIHELSAEQWRVKNLQGAKMRLQLFSTKSPEWMVNTFVTRPFDGGAVPWGRFEALFVSGANWQLPDLRELADIQSDLYSKGATEWRAEFYGETKPKGDTVEISVVVGYTDPADFTIRSHERVRLRREKIDGFKIWRIVPPKPEQIFVNEWHIAENGPINRMAAYIAYPKRAKTWLASRKVQIRLKALALAVFLSSEDYEGRLPKFENLEEALEVYVPDKSTYKSPLDFNSTKTLSFNKNLSNMLLKEVKDPAKVVAFYDGENMKLAFRYNGLAAVSFLDGHVEMVNPARAKSLRWKG